MSARLSRKQLIQLGAAVAGGTLLTALGCGDDEKTNKHSTNGSGSTSTGPGSGGSGNTGNTGNDGGTAGSGNVGGSQGGMAGQGGGMGICPATIVAQISQNHGHALMVPIADVIAGVDKVYDTTGSAMHCHQVTITAADFTALQNGEVVRVKSCNLTDHEYVLSCAPNPPPAVVPDCSMDPNLGSCN
jgi:hypothetical protein